MANKRAVGRRTTMASAPSRQVGKFDGRVALVTGASRGIGAAAARAFAQAGATVVLASRDAAALKEVAADIGRSGGTTHVIPTDIRDPRAIQQLLDETLRRCGRLDAAFNNAGGGHAPAPLADLALAEFDRVFGLNVRGTFVAMQHEILAMLERGGGAIVNMSSIAGLSAMAGMSAYVAAKHAIIGMTEAAALDYADKGVRLNVVAPGPILTNPRSAQARAALAARIPLGRMGRPDEVAAAVVWLCSDDASFVTGATIRIDGGKLAALV